MYKKTCEIEVSKLHNRLRSRHETFPLVLDVNMSKQAQEYAEFLVNNGCFEHSSSKERNEYEENSLMK
ncbi:unnamed protein product [Adineta steineri]|uniref:SCP domain-containing protein n=1 Tax=Adineta steineri TaxID=433720 RepID=A0A813Y9U3_9BILA|nr:unnamed protein product [Adineta steineri]CAF0881151.1 unnamed protein product [Adineta steineri]CAF0892067.1 unnamed protein product [Adineta steineri]